jgi:hypothetical protein
LHLEHVTDGHLLDELVGRHRLGKGGSRQQHRGCYDCDVSLHGRAPILSGGNCHQWSAVGILNRPNHACSEPRAGRRDGRFRQYAASLLFRELA